jgi:magnesium-protoporphyrin O-methyltransferase
MARYHRRGLDRIAKKLVEELRSRDIAGSRVLEIGDLSLELLKADAGTAINIELSPSWTEPAERLATELGLGSRYRHLVGDFADLAADLDSADVVVMHRAVCCYPDAEMLIGAAGDLCTRLMAMTYPSDHLGSKIVVGIENRLRRSRGSEFRTFVHPEPVIRQAASRRGLELVSSRRKPIWSSAIWRRRLAV